MKIGYAMKTEGYGNFPLLLQIVELQNRGCEKVYVEEDFIDGSITESGLSEMGVARKNIKEIHITSKDILMYMPSPEECPSSYVKYINEYNCEIGKLIGRSIGEEVMDAINRELLIRKQEVNQ